MWRSSKKPVIGVTRPAGGVSMAWYCIKMAILIAGGKPVRITTRKPRKHLHIDGLVISGGTDIHPERYGEQPKPVYHYDEARDKLEAGWLRKAWEENIPVLAICRGAQLMNIERGGNLHFDVSKAYEKAQYPSGLWARIFYRKPIHIEEGSQLHRILELTHCRVNSLHTQSVDRVGTGLKITAKEPNGVVQTIEDSKQRFCVGVQFHPEYLIHRRRFRDLFRALVEAAKERRVA